MKIVPTSVITAACLVLMTAPAAAQAPAIDLKINPRIGLYEPLSQLSEADDAAGQTATELSGSLALGLGAELNMALLPVAVRFNMDYATGSEVQYVDGEVETQSGVETTLLALVGDVMFRPLPTILIAQPYLFAGGGLKQYDFDFADDDLVGTFESESDWTVHVGGGLDVGVGPLSLNAEVGDYISWFELEQATSDGDSEIQHDLFVTIGFAIGLL